MAGKNGQTRRAGISPSLPMTGSIRTRRVLPVPANDNRVPPGIRLRQALAVTALAALLAWAAVEILAASL
jgi:hypothetical protein